MHVRQFMTARKYFTGLLLKNVGHANSTYETLLMASLRLVSDPRSAEISHWRSVGPSAAGPAHRQRSPHHAPLPPRLAHPGTARAPPPPDTTQALSGTEGTNAGSPLTSLSTDTANPQRNDPRPLLTQPFCFVSGDALPFGRTIATRPRVSEPRAKERKRQIYRREVSPRLGASSHLTAVSSREARGGPARSLSARSPALRHPGPAAAPSGGGRPAARPPPQHRAARTATVSDR